jgi:hypothetical protein
MRDSNQIAALNEFREAFESNEFEIARSALPQLADRLKDPVARHELLRSSEYVPQGFTADRAARCMGRG